MIELNLLGEKKPFRMPIVLGVDLSAINFVGMLVAIAFAYIPEMFIKSYYEDQMKGIEKLIVVERGKLKKLTARVRQNQGLKKKLDRFNKRIEELRVKEKQVQSILQTRKNPFNMLLFLAKNIPEDVWVNKISLENNNQIKLDAYSREYRSIGRFIENIDNSIYFNDSLETEPPQTVEDKELAARGGIEGARLEYLVIKGKVENLE